jgi:hypothetical protein
MNQIPTKREKTHGSFKDTASTSQNIKSVMMTGNNWERLNDSQREALEMIATKIGRILSGDPNFRDHWDDIEGYAELGGEGGKVSMPQVTLDIGRAMGASGE